MGPIDVSIVTLAGMEGPYVDPGGIEMSVPSGPVALIDPKQLPTIREAPLSERIAQAGSETLGLNGSVARLLAQHYLDVANAPTRDGFLHWLSTGRFQP